MQAIILCGGLATRLSETTKTIPKILLNIGNRTVLDWQLQLLKGVGVEEVILASGHLHNVLYERVGGCRRGVRMRYAREENRLGTGGAIRNAMKQIKRSPFFVLNGDVLLTDFSLQKMLDRFHGDMMGLLLSIYVDDVRPYGQIVSDESGKIITFREKQSVDSAGYINGGVYLFDETIAAAFPKGAVEHAVFSGRGIPMLSRCGHSFIKAGMRESQALFAGEASGHYYFRDNFYADNGMIPFLLVLEYLSVNGISLAEAVNPLRAAYPVSGEINFSFETRCHLRDAVDTVSAAMHVWGNSCLEAPIDGLSVRFLSGDGGLARGSWRFNLRESNTEPLLRLNVETIGDAELLIEKTMQISEKLESIGGRRETKFRWESENSV